MNSTRYGLLATITAFSACGTLLSPIVAQGQEEVSQETEVLTRGPVHEAFAETVSFEPEAGILISTQPPEPIDELPPEQELEGDNVTWIAGYWAWDEDLNDFMWISGVWRNVPPDREWVPGYWNDVGSQYQWVSGYWADAGTEEVAYLPEPPKSLERGPNIAAPSDDDVWVPGSWTYVNTDYRWRPGYWQPYRRNWAYVPDRYSWTPRGYVFVAGYWDYPVVNRGIIFAPVRFHGPVWRQPHYHYTPYSVININVVVNHLFVRPRYGHYYFGDYYEPRYVDRGFYSSVSFATARNRGFDPIFSYQRWEHRHDRNWERNRMDDYNYFRDNRDARPPQTWAALKDVGEGRRGFRNREGKEMAIATPLPVFAKNPIAAEGGGDTPGIKQRFKNLNQASREKIVNQRQELKSFAQKRKQIEKEAPAPVAKAEEGQPAPAVKPTKAKFQRSPVVGRKASQLAPDQAPPKRKAAPAIAEKDPTPDETAKPDDNQPDQPSRPGRGQGGRGQGGKGKGEAQDDTAKPDMTPDRTPKKEEVTPEREPKVKPQPEREPKVRPQPQPKKEEGTEREPKEKTEPQPKPEREPRVKPQPEREPKEPQPEREPKVKPQPTREPKEPQPEREPKVKPTPQPQPEREPKVKPQTERVQPQPQPKRERVEPQPKKEEAQPQPKRERVQPQPKKEEAQPQVKRQQAQPQAQPRERVQPQPQPQPKREQAQPQRERVQPQGGGGGGGGGKGGRGKEKDKEAAKE